MTLFCYKSDYEIEEVYLCYFNLLEFVGKVTLAPYVKNVSKMLSHMGSHQLANIAILSLRLSVANANGVQIQRNVMDHRLHVNSASKSVPLIDRMRIKR